MGGRSGLVAALEPQTEQRVMRTADVALERPALTALRNGETRYHALIERSSEVIALLDEGGTVLYVTGPVRRVLAMEPEAVVGRHALEMVHAEDRALVEATLARLYARPGSSETVVLRARHGESSWRWVECVTTNLLDDPQIRAVVSNFRDVTAQRQAQEEHLRLTRRLRLLLDVATSVGPSLLVGAPLEDALRTLVDALPETDTAAVLLYDPQDGVLVPRAFVGLAPEYGRIRLRAGEGLSGAAFVRGEAVRHEGRAHVDSLNATLSAENETLLAVAGGGKTYDHSVSVPLRAPTGEMMGVLTLGSNRAEFSADDQRLLEGVAAQLAVALENASLLERAQRDAVRAEAAVREYDRLVQRLAALAAAVGTGRDLRAIYRALRDFAVTETPASGLFISRYDAERRERTCVYAWGEDGEEDVSAFPQMPMNDSPHARAVATAEPVLCNDFQLAVAGLPQHDIGRSTDPRPPRSSLAVPMRVMGRVIGGFEVQSVEPAAFTPAHVSALRLAGNLAAVALENAQLHLAAENELRERAQAERRVRASAVQLEQAYRDLEQAQAALVQQERLKALGQLAAGIAHDLNNTLAPVVGYAELLGLQTAALTRQQREWLELVHAGALDAADVVRRLREFYRPRDEHDVFAPVDLASVVAQTVELTRPRWKDDAQAAGRTISVSACVAPETPPVLGSAAELREALTNLVFNAVDALPGDGHITVSTRVEGQSVVLEVADTGSGMAEEVRRRCLEPFFTTKGEKGTGLGLAMVHGTAQRHGGALEIESTPGSGTSVRLRLPASGGASGTHGGSTGRAAPPAEQLRLLVVDDEPVVRDVTAALLAVEGHSVAQVGSGAAALELLRREAFDALLTDRAMPGEMNGEQLAAAAKRLFPTLPVILVTGYGDLMQSAGELPWGVDTILAKPVTRERLRGALEQHAGARAAPPCGAGGDPTR